MAGSSTEARSSSRKEGYPPGSTGRKSMGWTGRG